MIVCEVFHVPLDVAVGTNDRDTVSDGDELVVSLTECVAESVWASEAVAVAATVNESLAEWLTDTLAADAVAVRVALSEDETVSVTLNEALTESLNDELCDADGEVLCVAVKVADSVKHWPVPAAQAPQSRLTVAKQQ